MPLQPVESSEFYAFIIGHDLSQGVTDDIANHVLTRRTYWHPNDAGKRHVIAAMRDLRERGQGTYLINKEVLQ